MTPLGSATSPPASSCWRSGRRRRAGPGRRRGLPRRHPRGPHRGRVDAGPGHGRRPRRGRGRTGPGGCRAPQPGPAQMAPRADAPASAPRCPPPSSSPASPRCRSAPPPARPDRPLRPRVGLPVPPGSLPQRAPGHLPVRPVTGYGAVGVTWASGTDVPEGDIDVEVRTRTDGTWSDWQAVEYHDDHGPDPGSQEARPPVPAPTRPSSATSTTSRSGSPPPTSRCPPTCRWP